MGERAGPDQRDPKTYAIIGAAMAVHRELGYDFSEPIYQEALAVEFFHRQIPFEKEKMVWVYYHNVKLESCYRADFVCYEDVIVELKALAGFDPAHEAQLINYLKATRLEYGLLLNFGTSKLQYKRMILSKDYKQFHNPLDGG
ncbi:MAG: GxxExxY protein [Planctomycetota bacterium]|nr:GxxExxY protein [Planctomycetota bacterium]MDA1211433.1 GxxExxY protein [Planctomycetota bacterium]